MNLFILDLDPDTNAQYHVDRHCSKMILEAMQLLCTTFHLQGIEAPYKMTHQNHPCTIFTRTSKNNFDLVVNYVYALSKEFTYRYDNIHKSSLLLKWVWENESKLSFPKKELTPIALAMPDQYKTDDPVQSYRNYYLGEKQHIFKWTNRTKPNWIV
jgi:hypothetical protein